MKSFLIFNDKGFAYGNIYKESILIDYFDINIDLVLDKLPKKKVYIKSKGLEKIADFDDLGNSGTADLILWNGPMSNFSSYMYYASLGFSVPNFQDTFENDSIIKRQYGPTYDRRWQFDKPVDNPEWLMQDTRSSI